MSKSLFRIRLLSLEMGATREPKPYHDRIVTSLIVTVGGQPVSSPDVPPDQVGKHAYCGFVGAGSVLDFTAFQPSWDHPLEFEFELDDVAPSTMVNIAVHVANVRGLPDNIMGQALLSMGVATATATAGLAAEALTTAAKWAVTLAAAVGGEGLKELIEQFALDVPKCRGTVFSAGIALTSEDLYGKPYDATTLPDGETRGSWSDSRWSDTIVDIPERGCGQPKAKLTYAIEKRTRTSFAQHTPIKFGRRAATRAPLSAWLGQWSDSPWSLSRVYIVIERGSGTGADLLKISIREAIGSYGGDVVVNSVVDDLPVLLGTHTPYAGDVFAKKSPFAPLLASDLEAGGWLMRKTAGGVPAQVLVADPVLSAAGSGAAVTLPVQHSAISAVPSPQPMHTQHTNPGSALGAVVTFDPAAPVLGASVQSSVALFDPGVLMLEKALNVAIPLQGVTLALYEVVVADGSGKETAVGHAVRYSRTANIWATQSDVMLTRYLPEKLA